MQSLTTTLQRLEKLKELVDEYSPIKYASTERSCELARLIPEAYGAIEDAYRRYAGDRDVHVHDGGHQKTFPNFFEAGWLSGRTFYDGEGYNELIKVIGRLKADVEDDTQPVNGLERISGAWTLLHPQVQVVAKQRYQDGHHADAVEAAFKELIQTIRELVLKRGGAELDGVQLMQTAFSANKPIIVLADLTTRSGRDMQLGYMNLFAGSVSAVRNPKAHGNINLSAERAMHLLFLASTLWHTLDDRP